MNNKYTALEGKVFTVDLMSNMASTNYGWCLTSMPDEIMLVGTDCIPVEPLMSGGRTIQRFHFGVKSSENLNVSLQFEIRCLHELSKVTDTYTLDVQIVPCNSNEYAQYSENAEQAAIPYGYVCDNNLIPSLKYGYPCTVAYGYPGMLYGYPCGAQDAAAPFVKYGYFCR